MAGDTLIMVAVFAAILGVAVLRIAWAQSRRSLLLNVAGWALLISSAVSSWVGAGAWGVSIAGLCGMGMASVLIVYAIFTAPPARAERASSKQERNPADVKDPKFLFRRFLTFVIVVLLAFAAALALGLTAHRLAILAGTSEADAIGIGLFSMPLIWTLLSFALLMTESRLRQFALLISCTLPSVAILLLGTK